MAKTFRQTDSRWGSHKYPSTTSNLANSGCGCVSCADLIVDNLKYSKYTPEPIRKWMVSKGFAIEGWGTAWAGIQKTLEYYGFTVRWPNTMTELFKLLDSKKFDCGILLFRAGSRGGITWTSVGHYVAFSGYKVKNGKHYLYMRDPGPRHNDGWFCYEDTMRGLVSNCWCAHCPDKKPVKTTKQVALEVIAGKWGTGNDRKKRLKKAGYNYAEVQKKVNELLGYGG